MSTMSNPVPHETHRMYDKASNCVRLTYRPDWSISRPWVSYTNGSAGLHFENLTSALTHFRAKGFEFPA